MKELKQITLVQFYLHEKADLPVDGSVAFLGPNGCGKSSTLDAIQIAMLGGNQRYAHYNAQSVSSKKARKISGYCLGLLRNPEDDSEVIGRARDAARTYIVLVFDDGKPGGVLSAGLCIEAELGRDDHDVKGLFVLPGQHITANDCVVIEGEDERPIEFAEFRHNARQRSDKLGRTPTFTDKSGEYVSELLYALNGQRMPDPTRFMSSFVKSMTLKNVDSVDQFIRDYVVEPNPVDIETFQKQVDQFIKLRDLVTETKEKIGQLMVIVKDYEAARRHQVKIANLEAIKAIFEVEQISEMLDRIEESIEQLAETKDIADQKSESSRHERDVAQERMTTYKGLLEADETEQVRLRLQNEIESAEKLIKAYENPLRHRFNNILIATRALLEKGELSQNKSQLKRVQERFEQAGSESMEAMHKVMNEMESHLKKLLDVAAPRQRFLTVQLESKKVEFESTKGRIQAAKRTGRLLDGPAAALNNLLSENGIDSTPMSALVKVQNPQWAPVIESYLGSDREALVVPEHQIESAIKLMRVARQNGYQLVGAGIIQPRHLNDVNPDYLSDDHILGLFETDNDVVHRFLAHKFGSMRQAVTESELTQFKRALTVDGTLTQGGMTKSIRVLSIKDLRLGKNDEDTRELSIYQIQLAEEINHEEKRLQCVTDFVNAMAKGSFIGDDESRQNIVRERAKIETNQQQIDDIDVSHLETYREQFAKAEKDFKSADEDFTQANRASAACERQIKDNKIRLDSLKLKMPNVQAAERTALENPLLDTLEMDATKYEIEEGFANYEVRQQEVRRRREYQNKEFDRVVNKATFAFNQFNPDFQLQFMNWEERFALARKEKTRLFDTQLQNYEKEAEEVRLASEETLRTDIAMSLYDRFKEMELEQRERNKILSACPAFTGGERYRFTCTVVKQHEALVRHIKELANSEQNFSLFSSDSDDVDRLFHDLIDQAVEVGSARSVLDYRQFYQYDLDILVNGKVVDKMSNRQGAGSNGEHIAPMYVAAGSALAKAYRLQDRKGQKQGSGIICLDEAFHGMDTNNSVATGEFLQSLGLQLVMAAPDDDRSKVLPVSRMIYDLDREGVDLLVELTEYTPKANALMMSDVPDKNPEIVIDAYEQLGLEVPQVSVEELQEEFEDE
ncbi:SbcC/MukB-like Walker B domain-containing protein [Litoribacillus peritrichatus]|uniref:SbcC/MukB-like Walker B domain-containing protein n=1 Tax=Litoribacillus peritrichatus TaxID=718191 RepID=A0ABP7MMD3_9GAMM